MLFRFGDDVLTRKRGWRKRAGTRPVNGRRIKNTEGGGCQYGMRQVVHRSNPQ